jgi:3-oxoacyl-[acyl-carrier-protein] synthase III
VPASKVPSNIARYGNTSGATIPILVGQANYPRSGRPRRHLAIQRIVIARNVMGGR